MSTTNDKLYWTIIEDMEWIKHSQTYRGYEIMKKEFMKNYNSDMAIKISDFVSHRSSDLYRAIDAYTEEHGRVGNFGGDDSFGDMVHHVVGLGQTYFDAVMENPKLLNNLQPVESFTYAIPYEEDYEKLNHSYHANFAKRCLTDLTEDIVEDTENNPDDYIGAAEIFERLCYLIAGRSEAAVGDIEFTNDYNRISEISTGAANCLFDYKRYMTK